MNSNVSEPWIQYAILAAGGVLGYFVISKLYDYFKRGSSWGKDRSPGTSTTPEVIDVEWQPSSSSGEDDMDAVRRKQEEEYRAWKNRDG